MSNDKAAATWSPFGEPDCPERSPKTGKQCVVGGPHRTHGADWTDWWTTPAPSLVGSDDGDVVVRGEN